VFDLTGRQAVVTGASHGIGQAIAIALAQAGADVASLYLTDPEGAEATAEAIRGHGRHALMVQGSTADPDAVERFAEQVERDGGPIDIWVNNAGQLLVRPFVEMTVEEWRGLMATNLDGYMHGCRAAVKRMLPRGRGRIVNISSATDVQPISDLTAYVATKGGIVGLTRALALELGPRGITVNAVAPGAIHTPLTQDAYTPEVKAAYEAKIAVGRIGRPQDIAGAVVFLASDEAAYVTGHELLADGGLTLNGNVGFAPTGS
jgi:NAD(P)-dependent dehydrogenase (short-subunit alcohol dehydrogenase family)